MWRLSECGRRGLIFGVLVWVAPVAGWAGVPPNKVPDAARLREAEKLKEDYERFYAQGKYDLAAEQAERACAILEDEHGNESAEAAGCLNDLAVFSKNQGNSERAKSLHERALAIREKVLGPNHSDIAQSLNNLASLYQAQGAYKKARPLYQRAISIFKRALGPDHPLVATSLHNLAGLYVQQGAYEKAEPLYRRALAIREKALGSNHPDVAQHLNALGGLYHEQGAYEKAEPLYQRAMAIWEEALGPGHPLVAIGLNNLAGLYNAQGAYEKAELLYQRALAVREKALGPDHPVVAQSLNNLASLYLQQGLYRKSEPLFERCVSIFEKALGPNHPLVATSLNNMASLYKDQGMYMKAEPLYQRALAIREQVLGSDHSHVATTLNNLGSLYQAQGAYGRAEPLYQRALTIDEKALGSDHPNIATNLNNLALLYKDQGEYGKAEFLFQRALVVWEKTLGPDHPSVATGLSNLASLYRDQGAYNRAEPLCQRALAIDEKALGPSHPHVAKAFNNLGLLYHDQGSYGKAKLLYERALAVWQEALGPDHSDVALVHHNLATLYHDQGFHRRALELGRHALAIEDANLVRALVVADEGRRLAHASALAGGLHYVLSLHFRVALGDTAIAELAVATLLRRKSRVQELVAQSTAALRRSLPENERHLLDDLSDVDSQIAVLTSRGPAKLAVEADTAQLDELRQERDRLWRELAKHSTLVEALGHPITIVDVQRGLPVGNTLVEFAQYVPQHDDASTRVRKHQPTPPPRYAAYILFPDRFTWVDLGPAAPIDAQVSAFRRALQTKQPIPTDLYDALMRPIVEKLDASTHHLIIAPAGDLSLIPFGALHDGHRYLIEQYDLRYVTTGRDLLPPPSTPPVTTTPITIVANPTGANLPDAELEADFLTTLFPHTRVLQGDQATETNVRTIERPLVLHMATHGFFGEALNERDNPMFRSGLYLADVDQVEVDRERDDGQLTAYEVSGMDLRGTELVVLSACETGLGAAVRAEGKELMSEGVAGLRRAFAMAGARTTVMSLWEVSGATTQKTMAAYYRKLAEGMGRGEAMQAVQLEMLRTVEHAHPKDWAAFIVAGDDTPLAFPADQAPRVETSSDDEAPPPVRRPFGCTIAGPSSDRAPSLPAWLLALLGIGTLRRRRDRRRA